MVIGKRCAIVLNSKELQWEVEADTTRFVSSSLRLKAVANCNFLHKEQDAKEKI